MRRSRRLLVAAVVLVIGLGAVLLGVHGPVTRGSLSYSVASTITDRAPGSGYFASCTSAGHRASGWRCALMTKGASDAGITYLLTTHGECWDGSLTSSAGVTGLPARAQNCIGLTDQIRIGDRISDLLGSVHRDPGYF